MLDWNIGKWGLCFLTAILTPCGFLNKAKKRRVELELEKDQVLVTVFELLEQTTAIIGIPSKFTFKSTNSPISL